MPSATAQTSKLTLRQALASRNGGFNPLTTSGAGNVGGTTARFSAQIGRTEGEVIQRWLMLTSGTNTGQYRRVLAFDPTVGDFTVPNAYSAQVASSVTAELHRYRPDLFWRAFNNVRMEAYRRGIYREVNSYIIPYAAYPTGTSQLTYGMPRNMRDVFRISVAGRQVVRDFFDRDDSTSNPGNSWVSSVGTWGVTSERLYSSSDTDADFIAWPVDTSMKNGVIQATLRGTVGSATDYRTHSIVFRAGQTFDGDLDITNCFSIRLLNGSIDLGRNIAGGGTSLASATTTTDTGSAHQLRVAFFGTNIKAWADDVLLIDHTLSGTSIPFLQNYRFGLRLDKGGSPATAASVDDFWAFSGQDAYEWTDWSPTGDHTGIQIPSQGDRTPQGILYVEGRAPLSPFATDTADQTILTDTTATIEIATTDEGWMRLLSLCEAELFDLYAKELTEEGLPTPGSATYRQMAAASREKAALEPAMFRPVSSVKRPM